MTRNKKGFTLVELVIVIAVIAILAGVMVAVFSGVVRRANESAELQQVKNQELAQKADDVLKKLDNANWFSWEDFENSLAAKLTETYKQHATYDLSTTVDNIKNAVKEAVEEFGKNLTTGNTSLTEAQVKAIVENALASAKLGGVTENQVRTIVNTAVADINTVSKSDVQKIVDAATAKGLTAEQVASVIGQSGLATQKNLTDVSEKVTEIINTINGLKPVTKEDLVDTIKTLVPVTWTVNGDSIQADFNKAVDELVSGSTIIVVSDTPIELNLTTSSDKTLYVKGDISTLTIKAANANIGVAGNIATIYAEEIAQNSLHVYGKVGSLTIEKGRVVVEDGAVVDELKAAPSVEATVKVVIEEEGTVKNLNAEYQKNGNNTNDWIEVENNGTVGTATLTVVAGDSEKTDVTTNVKVINGANATGTETRSIDSTAATVGTEIVIDEALAVVNSESKLVEVEIPEGKVARIGTTFYDTLQAAVTAAEEGDTVVLLSDVTINHADKMGDISFEFYKDTSHYRTRNAAIIVTKSMTIDGNGHTMNVVDTTGGSSNVVTKTGIGSFVGIALTESGKTLNIKNLTMSTPGFTNLLVGDNVENAVINIDDCSFNTKYYVIKPCVGVDNMTLNITDSSFTGWAAINTRCSNSTITVKNTKLAGINTASQSSWNTFATIVFDGDSYCHPEKNGVDGSNNTLTIINSFVNIETVNGNKQTWLGIQNGATGNVINVDSESFVANINDWYYTSSDESNSTTVTVAGTTYTGTLDE